jgi:hypothetical protein
LLEPGTITTTTQSFEKARTGAREHATNGHGEAQTGPPGRITRTYSCHSSASGSSRPALPLPPAHLQVLCVEMPMLPKGMLRQGGVQVRRLRRSRFTLQRTKVDLSHHPSVCGLAPRPDRAPLIGVR